MIETLKTFSLSSIIRWSLLESGVYELLLFAHYYWLFSVVPAEHYGMIGTLISLIYLAVYRMSGPLEEAINTFFLYWSPTKESVKQVLLRRIFPTHLLITFTIGTAFYLLFSSPFTFEFWVIFFSALVIITELLKKTLRCLLKLLLYNRLLAMTEIFVITAYIAIIWFAHISGYTLSLLFITLALLIDSLIGLVIYFIAFLYWYNQLPKTGIHSQPTHQRVGSVLIVSSLNQITTMWYSSSFLVPLIAASNGFVSAGFFKLFTAAVNAATKLFDKVLTTLSITLFAHTKYAATHIQQDTFVTLITHSLRILLVVFTILIAWCLIYGIPLSHHYILYILMIFCDRITALYERFFTIQEHLFIPLTLNTLGTLCLYSITQQGTVTIAIILAIRFTILTILSAKAYSNWNILPVRNANQSL